MGLEGNNSVFYFLSKNKGSDLYMNNIEDNVFNQCNRIINNINIESVENTRSILDGVLRYVNRPSDDMVEFKEQDLMRIMVNYIRHDKSSYENDLIEIHNISRYTTYGEDIYRKYKNAVLSRISSMYPYLSSSCDKQKLPLNMIRNVNKE